MLLLLLLLLLLLGRRLRLATERVETCQVRAETRG